MVTDSGPPAKDGSGSSVLPRVGKRGAPQAFARKLYEILTTESQDVIAWNADGTAFHVKDVDNFSVETLTKYYRHSKFSSFQRQLNLYSFRKIVKGPDAGGYAHPMFHRDRPDDLYHVRRSISGSGKYEPSASKTTAAAAVRRNAGRSASKASGGTEWLPGRAHKSSGATRRVGKIRSSPGSAASAGSAIPSSPACASRADRGNVVATPSPSSAAASSTAATADVSAGERSPWTSGESSDSDVSVREAGEARDSSSDESDSDVSEAEEEGKKQQRDSGRSRANIGSVGRGAAGVSKGGNAEQVAKGTTSRQSKASKSGERLGQDHSGSDDQAGLEQAVPPASASPSRTSTFNFFKKTFSFMERQSSSRHNRAPSVSSVDMTAAEQQQPAATTTATNSSSSVDPNNPIADSVEDISRLLVDTSATARAAAAGIGARPPPVTVTGRLSVDPTTIAGNKVLTSSPLTPKSSAGAGATAAATAATAAATAAAAMPPPPKREQREELGLVEQLTNMVEVFDICDLLRKVSNSNSSRLDKHGGIVKPATGWGTGSNSSSSSQQSYHARNMSVDSSPLPQSPQTTRDGQGGLGSLASMELVRDSSKEWDTLMVGSADVSDLSNTMVQSVAEFFSF